MPSVLPEINQNSTGRKCTQIKNVGPESQGHWSPFLTYLEAYSNLNPNVSDVTRSSQLHQTSTCPPYPSEVIFYPLPRVQGSLKYGRARRLLSVLHQQCCKDEYEARVTFRLSTLQLHVLVYGLEKADDRAKLQQVHSWVQVQEWSNWELDSLMWWLTGKCSCCAQWVFDGAICFTQEAQ